MKKDLAKDIISIVIYIALMVGIILEPVAAYIIGFLTAAYVIIWNINRCIDRIKESLHLHQKCN